MAFEEECLESRMIHDGRIIRLRLDRVRLPDGREASREVVEHPGAVAVVPLLGDQVVLVRQFRYATGTTLLEIPAGRLDPGEDPAEAARRELREETGYRCGSLRKLGQCYSTPGFTNEVMHLFVAEDLVMDRPSPDEDEFLAVEHWSLQEALSAVGQGRLQDAKTLLGLLWLQRR